MSTTDSTECDRLKVAVAKIVALPGLTVKDAMKLADFSRDEIEDKSMQRKVYRRLPGKGKRNMRELTSESAEEGSIMQSVDVENINNSDVSPITDDSATSLLNSDGKQMQKSRRLTVSQKQEQRVEDYANWLKKKEAHKAATTLYSEQLSIQGGMSLRDVEKKIKSDFKVGPSKETIRRHVVDLNSVGISPTKHVLAWYGIKKLNSMGRQAKIDKWREIQSKNGQPATIERWTDELEEQLIAASKTDIEIGDTAVGRYEQRRMEDFVQAAPKFTDDQWAQMVAERERNSTATTQDDNSNVDNAGNH